MTSYATQSPAWQSERRQLVYYYVKRNGPSYAATIRNRLGLTEDHARDTIAALVASGGLTLLEQMSGETQGRYRANEVER